MRQCWCAFPGFGAATLDKGQKPMAQRVFVNVAGFTDEERHALNLLFRMSEDHSTAFSAWEAGAPQPPRVAFVDGDSDAGRAAADDPRNTTIPLLWVGANAPARALLTFARPIAWPDVLQTLDSVFPAEDADLHFDIDYDDVDTQPPDTMPPDGDMPKRALIASGTLEERLYLRARLALAGFPIADEAETAPKALELVRERDYVLAIVDLSLGGMRGWDFLKELAGGPHKIAKVIVTASRPTIGERLKAHRVGVKAFIAKPPHPAKLQAALAQD
jgi:CheY-like chemotaxis protein